MDLLTFRKSIGMSQVDMGKMLGVNGQQICQLESGKSNMTTTMTILLESILSGALDWWQLWVARNDNNPVGEKMYLVYLLGDETVLVRTNNKVRAGALAKKFCGKPLKAVVWSAWENVCPGTEGIFDPGTRGIFNKEQ